MSLTSREALVNDAVGWDELVLSSPASSFLQTWQWGVFQEALGRHVYRLVVEKEGQMVAVALLIRYEMPFGRCYLYIPAGPIIRDELSVDEKAAVFSCLQESWLSYAKKESAVYVRIDPLWQDSSLLPDVWRKSSREIQPKDTLLLQLASSPEELLLAMHQKTRYNIRLAERHGVTVRFSTQEKDLEAFLSLGKEVSHRSAFSYHPDTYYKTLLATLATKHMAELAVAEYNGEIIAVHFMVYAGRVASYVHGASSQSQKKIMAPHLLYWQTILRAKEKQCDVYDFYGVAPQDTSSGHPWAGISRIKAGFGGTYRTTIGAYDLVVKLVEYALMNIARSLKSAIQRR